MYLTRIDEYTQENDKGEIDTSHGEHGTVWKADPSDPAEDWPCLAAEFMKREGVYTASGSHYYDRQWYSTETECWDMWNGIYRTQSYFLHEASPEQLIQVARWMVKLGCIRQTLPKE